MRQTWRWVTAGAWFNLVMWTSSDTSKSLHRKNKLVRSIHLASRSKWLNKKILDAKRLILHLAHPHVKSFWVESSAPLHLRQSHNLRNQRIDQHDSNLLPWLTSSNVWNGQHSTSLRKALLVVSMREAHTWNPYSLQYSCTIQLISNDVRLETVRDQVVIGFQTSHIMRRSLINPFS